MRRQRKAAAAEPKCYPTDEADGVDKCVSEKQSVQVYLFSMYRHRNVGAERSGRASTCRRQVCPRDTQACKRRVGRCAGPGVGQRGGGAYGIKGLGRCAGRGMGGEGDEAGSGEGNRRPKIGSWSRAIGRIAGKMCVRVCVFGAGGGLFRARQRMRGGRGVVTRDRV